MLVLEGLVGLNRFILLLQHQLLGIDLNYCDVGLPWKQVDIILSFLRLHPSTVFQTLLLTMRAASFLLRDCCP